MVAPSTGLVVLVLFPFSDLWRARLRPAVVPAHAGKALALRSPKNRAGTLSRCLAGAVGRGRVAGIVQSHDPRSKEYRACSKILTA